MTYMFISWSHFTALNQIMAEQNDNRGNETAGKQNAHKVDEANLYD